jgi:hypothetical protein
MLEESIKEIRLLVKNEKENVPKEPVMPDKEEVGSMQRSYKRKKQKGCASGQGKLTAKIGNYVPVR